MTKKGGLAGIVAGESAISTVGLGHGLNYRGYNVDDLSKDSNFEEVAFLLLVGHLPNIQEINQFNKKIYSQRQLPILLIKLLESIPKSAHPMEVMRTICSYLGVLEPESEKNDQMSIAIRLIAIFGPSICYWYHFSHNNIRIQTVTKENDSVAANFCKLILQKNVFFIQKDIDPLVIKTVDVSLILYAEHDYNASTFAARVTASTKSDFYSALCSGIGALRGNLHGGANEAAMEFLEPLQTIEQADQALNYMFRNKKMIMGFGHRVYQKGDPRSPIIKEYSRQLSLSNWIHKNRLLFQISEHIENRMLNEKFIHANLDFFAASAYHQCGIPTGLFTPIFVISRTTGWAAHVFEQRANNKLIRPISIYIGPERKQYVKIDYRPKL